MKKTLTVLLVLLANSQMIHSATSLDAGNYDISWYDPNETEFYIKGSKQFAGIAYLVNNGYDSFKDKTIYLSYGKEINLSNISWIPIGTPNNPFQGSIICNSARSFIDIDIRIDKDSGVGIPLGLFGTVKDAYVEGIKIWQKHIMDYYAKETNAGAFAGKAYNSKFINCGVVGDIDITVRAIDADSYVVRCGGLVGYANDCEFINCYMASGIKVLMRGEDYGAYYTLGSSLIVGGIVGSGSNVKLLGCESGQELWGYSDEASAISVGRAPSKNQCATYSYIGGIAGSLSSKSVVEGCRTEYGEISSYPYSASSTTSSLMWDRYVGGIVGDASTSYGYGIYNSYCAAKLNNRGYNAIEGGIAGNFPDSNDWGGNFSWSIKSYGYNGGYNGATSYKRRDDMASDEFLNELNLWTKIHKGEKAWVRTPHLGNDYENGLPTNMCYKPTFYTMIDGFRYFLSKDDRYAELSSFADGPLYANSYHISYPGLSNAIIPSCVKFNDQEYQITKIHSAFWNNRDIKDVDIPMTVVEINNAFRNNTGLEKIICRPLTPPAIKSENEFDGMDVGEIKLVIDIKADKSYETDEVWGKFNIVREELGSSATLIDVGPDDGHEDENFYDIQGRLVAKPISGQLLIHNGRKIIFKE